MNSIHTARERPCRPPENCASPYSRSRLSYPSSVWHLQAAPVRSATAESATACRYELQGEIQAAHHACF
jgi:hypothetical protein